MCFTIVSNMVGHTGRKQVLRTIFQFGDHGTFNAIDDVPLATPMIRQVARRIRYLPDADGVHLEGLPGSETSGAFMSYWFNIVLV